jgi:hypothetical protein
VYNGIMATPSPSIVRHRQAAMKTEAKKAANAKYYAGKKDRLTMSAADNTESVPRNLRVVWIQLYLGDQKTGHATKIRCKFDFEK